MDPQATLDRAEQLFNELYTDDADFGEFKRTMRAYAMWRKRGGFEPKNGDSRYGMLQSRYGVFMGNHEGVPDLE